MNSFPFHKSCMVGGSSVFRKNMVCFVVQTVQDKSTVLAHNKIKRKQQLYFIRLLRKACVRHQALIQAGILWRVFSPSLSGLGLPPRQRENLSKQSLKTSETITGSDLLTCEDSKCCTNKAQRDHRDLALSSFRESG